MKPLQTSTNNSVPNIDKQAARVTRRGFLKAAGLAGGGLALWFYLDSNGSAQRQGTLAGEFVPNAFLRVSGDDSVLIYSKGPEIGQGIKTAFALIIAEELDADWSKVRVEQAPIDPDVYGRQGAGGSTSIPSNWDQLRRAGAMARAMLVNAAAAEWQIPATDCRTEAGKVIAKDGRMLSYGQLADRAGKLPVPNSDALTLKARGDYRLLGKRHTGVDNLKVVTGQPLFGIDTVLPGMLYAVYEKCPAFGGKVKSANLEEIKRLSGIKDAFVLEGTGQASEVMPGVAIVATSTWAAFNAKKQLRIAWDEAQSSKDDWLAFVAQAARLAKQPGQETLRNSGDVDKIFADRKPVEAFYSYPFVAHATLEPQNCTAWHRDGGIEIWAPSQQADTGRDQVAKLLDLRKDRVTVHQTRVGGGFGRRLINDYMLEVALISQRVNAPVKLTWTREDDMTHDLYRPAGFHAFRGAVDAYGKLAAWQDHFISFTADGKGPVRSGNMSPEEFPALLVANVRLSQTLLPSGTPTGPLRAPGSNAIAFAIQSFLHELSVAAKRDHREFLLDIMGEPRWLTPGNMRALNTERAAAVIRLAAEKGNWSQPLPKGRGRGLAFHFSHAGHFAEVAEVSVNADKRLTVHRVTVAGDIGPLINLSGAEAQCQGSVVDGLSIMFGQRISLRNGRVQEKNFDQYSLLRLPHAPPVDVHFVQSDYAPSGAGEPALPPLAPAVCNAIFAATGERVRTLPLTEQGFTLA